MLTTQDLYEVTQIDRDCQAWRMGMKNQRTGSEHCVYVVWTGEGEPQEGDVVTFMEEEPQRCYEGIVEDIIKGEKE